MGFCREPIGRIIIETRRESFYLNVGSDEYLEIEYTDLPDLIRALVEMRDDRQQEAPKR